AMMAGDNRVIAFRVFDVIDDDAGDGGQSGAEKHQGVQTVGDPQDGALVICRWCVLCLFHALDSICHVELIVPVGAGMCCLTGRGHLSRSAALQETATGPGAWPGKGSPG